MIFLEIGVVIGLTVLNGLLAMSELAIVSSRRARLETFVAQGVRGARTALRLIDDPARFLSTVQIGITLVGIFAGAYGGAKLADKLAVWLNQFAVIAPHGDDVAITVVVIGITYMSLIVGELVPKRIAMNNPEIIATWVARPMDRLSRFGAPAVWILRKSTEGILALLGLNKSKSDPISEEEVKSLIAEGTRAGTFELQEKEMIDSVLRLGDRTVRAVMTPRKDIHWLDVNDTPEAMIRELLAAQFSRLPVCDGAVDTVIGVVTTKDVLSAVLRQRTLDVRALMKPPIVVPDSMPLLKLIEFFRVNAVHMAVVVDERGVTEGLVSTTDVLESIAGQLPHDGEDAGPGITPRADGSWLVDGAMLVDEFADRILAPRFETGGEFATVAGLVLYQMKHIPKTGDTFTYAGLVFEVVDMDGTRIDKLLVSRLPRGDA